MELGDRATVSSAHAGCLVLRAVLVATGLLLVAACTDPAGPEGEVRVGVITGFGMGPDASAPDTVEQGAPFEVSVRTFGNGCTTEGETDVRAVGAGTVEVTPYDVHVGHVCHDILRIIDHRATLVVHEPGVLLVRFRGQGAPEGEPVSVERDVFVR